MAERKIRVGIVGTGGISHRHAHFYGELPWVEVAGVADVVGDRAEAAAEKWGVPLEHAYESHEELIERVELDAVSVCTYNMGHRAPTVDALEAGLHVLLEKPMAATLEDAQAIMRAWEKSGKILMVAFQPHFSTEHQAARQVVDSGALGEIYYGETVTHRRWGIPGGSFLKKETAGSGTLVDTGVYRLYTALWLMDAPKPVTVSAMTASYLGKAFKGVQQAWGGAWKAEDIDVEEFAAAFVRFESGAVLNFKSSWAANADSLGRTFFLGKKAGMAIDPLEVYTNHQIDGLNMTATPQGLRKIDDWQAKVHAFAKAVREGGPSPIDPRTVFLVNVVMDGILRSADARAEVKVSAAY